MPDFNLSILATWVTPQGGQSQPLTLRVSASALDDAIEVARGYVADRIKAANPNLVQLNLDIKEKR